MRQTLQEYTIEYGNSVYDSEIAIKDVLNYAKLTNRAPRLGDFVPTDEDDNVLEEPKYWKEHLSGLIAMADTGIHLEKCKQYQTAKDKVIFAGDWEVVQNFESYTVIQNENGVGIIFVGKQVSIGSKEITRIEDLPREIEFKNGVI